MAAIFESETLGPTERLIMLALADHADDDGRCYPSMKRLEQRTGLSDRAIQKNMKSLADAGYLAVKPNAGQGGANLYIINAAPELGSPPNVVPPERRSPPPPNVVRQTPERRSDKPSGTIIGTINTPPPPKGGEDATVRSELLSVLKPETVDAFIAHRKAKRAKLTRHAANLIARKLAECPDPDAVVERSIMQGWTGVFPDPGPTARASPDRQPTASEILARIAAQDAAAAERDAAE